MLNAITPDEIHEQLHRLGVPPGATLLAHTSFRAVRPVLGGPLGVIESLLDAVGPDGTLVMPSWTGDDTTPFDPRSTPAAADLGVTADVFWRQPDVRRSTHAFAFAAKGRHAAAIVADPLPLPPHRLESPVGRVFEHDGSILLLGVGHDANTTIHLAEILAGVPYGIRNHCMAVVNGRAERIEYLENDHCCLRFALADEWLRGEGLQREGHVGAAHARLVRSRDVVEVVKARLETEPLIFLHDASAGCAECDRARASVQLSAPPTARPLRSRVDERS